MNLIYNAKQARKYGLSDFDMCVLDNIVASCFLDNRKLENGEFEDNYIELEGTNYFKVDKQIILSMLDDEFSTKCNIPKITKSINKLIELKLLNVIESNYKYKGNWCMTQYYSEGYDLDYLHEVLGW